jgi:hypothetical protein
MKIENIAHIVLLYDVPQYIDTCARHNLKIPKWYVPYEAYYIRYTEKELSEVMYFLEEDGNMTESVRCYLQKAGKNIFGW